MDLITKINELGDLIRSKFNAEEPPVEMGTATLTDGTILTYEGELAVGTMVSIETPEGTLPAPDGSHEIEGGTIITVADGIVVEILEASAEVAEAEVEEAFNAAEFESKILAKVAEMFEGKFSDLHAKFAEVKESVETEIATSRTILEGLEGIKSAFGEMPKETPARAPKQEFKAMTQREIAIQMASNILNTKKQK